MLSSGPTMALLAPLMVGAIPGLGGGGGGGALLDMVCFLEGSILYNLCTSKGCLLDTRHLFESGCLLDHLRTVPTFLKNI